MKKSNRVSIIVLLFALISAQWCAAETSSGPAEHFRNGIVSYSAGEYRDALEHFLAAEQTTEGFAINYNLANTYYKLGKIPESILHYERALKFEPGNDDARYNLRLANERIADRIESLPVSKISLWWDELRFGLGPDVWAYITLGLAVLSGLMLLIFLLGSKVSSRRFGFFTALLLTVLAVTSHSIAGSAYKHRYTETSAIVFTPKVDVRSEPRTEATATFVLHSGTRVELLQRFEAWYEIEIANGNKGWLPAEDVVEI